ncbi:nitrile hydratase subunit beta [Enemella dayhoffiae]|uniref:nitrile hydratase n=1 Tax=Enemella dayhoffiae TaxID=2016507 RepID=A0A255GQE6_9ACTN|nr:nitrile hydratase subunit beta [Enemella dayhoffiae]OYO18050.1 nitrile hydratase subunit beta [Enemella dayhoffiae]
MSRQQDVGGRTDLGPVHPEPDEPTFHAEWERRTLALTLATGALGRWNIDQSRSARERLPGYLHKSYYRIWLEALEGLLRRSGLLDDCGVRARTWAEMLPGLQNGSPYDRETAVLPAYRVGQRVRTTAVPEVVHTRLPAYAAAKIGTVSAVHGAFVFPDRNAVPIGEVPDRTPEFLYTVEFAGTELWGSDAGPGLVVSVDAFEPYLRPVEPESP